MLHRRYTVRAASGRPPPSGASRAWPCRRSRTTSWLRAPWQSGGRRAPPEASRLLRLRSRSFSVGEKKKKYWLVRALYFFWLTFSASRLHSKKNHFFLFSRFSSWSHGTGDGCRNHGGQRAPAGAGPGREYAGAAAACVRRVPAAVRAAGAARRAAGPPQERNLRGAENGGAVEDQTGLGTAAGGGNASHGLPGPRGGPAGRHVRQLFRSGALSTHIGSLA